uniref:Transmembrane protein n=1 Tax=Opuntia streptacantha TaxID=393608 RepID=A0A7C9ARB1_OPUST
MDNISSNNRHFDIDLEKGGLSEELGSGGGLVFGPIRMNQLYSQPVDGGDQNCNASIKSEEGVISSNSSCVDGSENVKSKVVDRKGGEERSGEATANKQEREKPKAMSAKKPPRPPRPPRGLSLDSADQKLIRELHELAKLKRARIERMKALKKAKEAKAASWKSNSFATLLTVLFALVLLSQGISVKKIRIHSAANFQGSPISSGTTEGSVVSVQQHTDTVPSTSNVNGPDYQSLSYS